MRTTDAGAGDMRGARPRGTGRSHEAPDGRLARGAATDAGRPPVASARADDLPGDARGTMRRLAYSPQRSLMTRGTV